MKKNNKSSNVPIPNEFLMDNLTRALAIHNFMIISAMLERNGIIENRKSYREAVVNDWVTNIKSYMQKVINVYAEAPDSISVEDFQHSSNKTLVEFKKFVDAIMTEQNLDDGDDTMGCE